MDVFENIVASGLIYFLTVEKIYSYIVTTCPLIETALYGRSVEEVYAAGKPHPSLQGCIYGVFRNRSPIEGRAVTVYLLIM